MSGGELKDSLEEYVFGKAECDRCGFVVSYCYQQFANNT